MIDDTAVSQRAPIDFETGMPSTHANTFSLSRTSRGLNLSWSLHESDKGAVYSRALDLVCLRPKEESPAAHRTTAIATE